MQHLYRKKKVGHRYSISKIGGQKDTRSLPGHTGFWNVPRLQTWNDYSYFLGNILGMKKILILIVESQWKLYSSGRCLIESALLEKYSDIIYHNRTLNGHQACRDGYCSFNSAFSARQFIFSGHLLRIIWLVTYLYALLPWPNNVCIFSLKAHLAYTQVHRLLKTGKRS